MTAATSASAVLEVAISFALSDSMTSTSSDKKDAETKAGGTSKGQKAASSSTIIRKAFTMSVYKGQEEEYERRHNPIPDELAAVLKSHGVSNYSIFLSPDGTLFAYCEITSEKLWNSIGDTAECKRWWKYMKPLMPAASADSDAPAATTLKSVFHLP